MLKFIVLGLVPGTNIQLSFFQIALAACLFYGAVLLLHERQQRRAHKQSTSKLLS